MGVNQRNRCAASELCFEVRSFAPRKTPVLLRAKATAILPGGFGTMDERFEALAPIQTGRTARIPAVPFGTKFWRRAIDPAFLIDAAFPAGAGTTAPGGPDCSTSSTRPGRAGR